MGPGDLVRIVSENPTHGGKIALIVGTDLNSWYDVEIGRERDEIVYQILIDGRVRNVFGERWLEVISETR